jgi:uncharacterized protein DUF6496
MPEKETLRRAQKDRRAGKSASTQAGEFVREEIHHVREGKHGARTAKQAIAIGLSKARRAGVDLPPQQNADAATKKKQRKASKRTGKAKSPTRARAARKALAREGTQSGSKKALSRQASSSARRRTAKDRSTAAKKAARTKGVAGRKTAARKAARTRAAHHA